MDTDYRKLCIELFGTDDVPALTELAGTLNKRNTRNAGRKKKFSPDDIEHMKGLRAGGMTVNAIAAMYGTSRQVIGRYLNTKPDENTTLRMTYMFRQQPCTTIDVDFFNERIKIQNHTNDLLHRAFGVIEAPTWEDFNLFLRERCFPETRGNAKQILRHMGIDSYDPLQIVEKTKGRMAEDELWLKFNYYPRKGVRA